MPSDYVKQTWAKGQAGGTPISDTRLQHIEDGIEGHTHPEHLAAIDAHEIDPLAHTGTYVEPATLAASGKGWVNHGATAGTARPTGYASVEWYGSVEPTNAVNGDTWVSTA